ncbi:hypothetical protein RB195_013460 [Necator americanus]|uniref:Reverse transcriptase domain-containing protein n=1 Tax=Necator americanus TaxID=51031 RepID=A0ABR1DX42_NECAM
MLTLKLQLDYVLTRNILVSDICKCRAFRDVTFNADHSPVLLIFIVAQEELKSFTLTKLHTVGLKDEECRTKFRQRMPIHVGVRTRRKVCDADSSAKCIQDDRGKHFQFRCCGRELLSDFNQKSACKELAVQQGRSWTDICGQRGTTNRVVGSGQQQDLFNFAIDAIMQRIIDQCPTDIILAPSGRPLTYLRYADDVIFAESKMKLQHAVNVISKLAAA